MEGINVSQQKFKPTLDKESRTEHGEKLDKTYDKTMRRYDIDLTEVDQMLNEKTKSIKKQIWDLNKMEGLVHSDQKLSAIYNEMAEDGNEKYGYHYNETIMNIIFNEYVLNSVNYLSKYKSAIPVQKKRRDQTGINKLQNKDNEKEKTDDENIDENVPTHINSLAGVQSDNFDENVNDDVNYNEFRINKKYDTLDNQKDMEETTGSGSSGAFSAKAGFDPMNDNDKMMYEDMENNQDELNLLKAEAQRISSEEGVAQHVNSIGNGKYKIDDFYDSDNTVASYENGRSLNENDNNQDELDETTTSSSSGAYETPFAFAKGKSRLSDKPAWDGGEIVGESYITNPDTFRLIFESLDANNIEDIDEAKDSDDPCWKNYEQIGMKDKGGKQVPNCVPIDEDNNNDSLVPNALEEHNLQTHTEKCDFLSDILGKDMQVFLAMPEEIVNQLYLAYENEMIGESESMFDDNPTSMASNMADVQSPIMESKKCRDGEIPNPKKEKEYDPDCIKKDTYYKNKKEGKYNNKEKEPKEDRFNKEERDKREKDYKKKLNQEKMKYNKELKETDDLIESLKKLSSGEELSEDKKPATMVMLDRLKNDNKKNFKGDMKDSNSTKIAASQGNAERADEQYTDIDDPQALSKKIEKNKLSQNDGESFENVGDSTNDTNDEIPKRNRTKEEQEAIALNRGYGMDAIDYDIEPSERFEKRAEKDMGEEFYKIGREKVKQRNNQVMYNKDEQPTKEVSEGLISAKYYDNNNQTQFVNFDFDKVNKVSEINESFVKLNLDGLGNTYYKDMNENVNMRNVMDNFEFYLNKSDKALTPIVAVKRQSKQLMSEGKEITQEPINEGLDKMKKLWGYKPSNYVNNKNIKKNRGF